MFLKNIFPLSMHKRFCNKLYRRSKSKKKKKSFKIALGQEKEIESNLKVYRKYINVSPSPLASLLICFVKSTRTRHSCPCRGFWKILWKKKWKKSRYMICISYDLDAIDNNIMSIPRNDTPTASFVHYYYSSQK